MIRIPNLAAMTLLVFGVAVTGCGSSSRGPSEASAGSGGASEGQAGGGGTDAGGDRGTAGGGGSGDSNTSGGGAAGSAGATALGGDAGSATAGGATGTTPIVKQGRVLLYSVTVDQATRRDAVYATFYTAASGQCTSVTIGACQVNLGCSQAPEPVSAGTLSVTSPEAGTLPANAVTISPSANATYPSSALSGAFMGGEALHIAASGATVPAFSSDLTAPLPLLIDSPVPSNTGTISTTSAGALLLKFSRGASDVMLYAESSDGTIECYSDPGTSTLLIPQSALAGADTLYLYTLSTRNLTSGDYAITTGILMNALTPDRASSVKIVVN